MDLQVSGKCTKVFNTQYTSKKDGQVHSKHHFVIEMMDGQYAKKICFTVMDDERWSKMNVVEGGTYNVSFDVSSREYNGNYYTDVNAWRAVRVDNQAQNTPTPTPVPTQAHAQQTQQAQQPVQQPISGGYVQHQNSNDLPF